jgi:chaperonin cofactor prefoldin
MSERIEKYSVQDLDARISMLESVVEDNYTRIDILEAILYKEYSDKKILKEGIPTNIRW